MSFSFEGFDLPEGSTPISDFSELKLEWVRNMGDLNRVEAENIMEAHRKFLQRAVDDPKNWFNTSVLKKIHQEMFGNVWGWAGRYRKCQTSIGIQPGLIPSQLAIFTAEVQSWSQHSVELTFLEMAAQVHHRLVFIHPFENGNGRFSRLVADRILLAWRCPYPLWPSNLGGKCEKRREYIHALKNADKGDYGPLIDLMKGLGAQNPTLGELLNNQWYRKTMNDDRLQGTMKALLRSGCDANEKTSKGHLPLQLAIKTGSVEMVQLLLTAGADLNTPDRSGLTPFQVAVMQENKTIADLLASKGAKRHIPPGLGYKAYYNLYGEQLPGLLTNHWASPNG
jgi:Fic-DOC domain mobile mystery protein B